jgi:lycopene beta-cyclase
VASDVVVVGGGPAALAAAAACARTGLGVVVLAGPERGWEANYGAWADELEALGFGDVLGPVWDDAEIVVDGTPRTVGRRYARVDREALRARLLADVAAAGGRVVQASLVAARHDTHGSTVDDDAGTAWRTRLVVDATGHRPALVRRRGEPTLWQAAWGVWAHPIGADGLPAFDPARAVFMDFRADHGEAASGAPTFLYAMPLGGGRAFVEETSLVRGPAVGFAVLERRLRARLAARGVELRGVEGVERCLFPMDPPLPDLDQRVVGFGAAASLVHPASGYQLGRAFATAPDLAVAVADGLRRGLGPDAAARDAWRAVWTEADVQRRELHLFGTRLVATLGLHDTCRFFETFFAMPREVWTGYLAGRGDVGSVLRAMASMLWFGGARTRWNLVRSGTRLPGVLLRSAV